MINNHIAYWYSFKLILNLEFSFSNWLSLDLKQKSTLDSSWGPLALVAHLGVVTKRYTSVILYELMASVLEILYSKILYSILTINSTSL